MKEVYKREANAAGGNSRARFAVAQYGRQKAEKRREQRMENEWQTPKGEGGGMVS